MSISSSLLTSQLNDVNSVLQGGHGGKRSLGMLLMMTFLLNTAIWMIQNKQNSAISSRMECEYYHVLTKINDLGTSNEYAAGGY